MHVIADLNIVPIGVGVSLSKYVAACEREIIEAGLKVHLHAFGTNIEGDWDSVLRAIKQCHELLHEMNAPRVLTTVTLSTRTDREQSIEEKINSVKNRL